MATLVAGPAIFAYIEVTQYWTRLNATSPVRMSLIVMTHYNNEF